MKYIVELINQTHTANIYGIYLKSMEVIGTVEEILTGPYVGTYAYTLSGKHTRNDIKKIYKQEVRN